MTNWLEVSLTVNGELAEAVADVLARFAPNGVMTEQAGQYEDVIKDQEHHQDEVRAQAEQGNAHTRGHGHCIAEPVRDREVACPSCRYPTLSRWLRPVRP